MENLINGITGLTNQGNTCYVNSIIQCLSNCKDFRNFLLHNKIIHLLNKSDNIFLARKNLNNTLTFQLRKIFSYFWFNDYKIIELSSFRKIFCKKIDMFRNFNQHDSQEALLCIIDTIHEELAQDYDIVPKNKDIIFDSLNYYYNNNLDYDILKIINNDISKYLNFKSFIDFKNTHKNYSDIYDIFEGRTISQLKCPLTNGIKANFESQFFFTLSLINNQFDESTEESNENSSDSNNVSYEESDNDQSSSSNSNSSTIKKYKNIIKLKNKLEYENESNKLFTSNSYNFENSQDHSSNENYDNNSEYTNSDSNENDDINSEHSNDNNSETINSDSNENESIKSEHSNQTDDNNSEVINSDINENYENNSIDSNYSQDYSYENQSNTSENGSIEYESNNFDIDEDSNYVNLFTNLKKKVKKCNIYDLFDNFSKMEILDNENQWFSPYCQQKVNAEKINLIWDSPKVFIILIKRFEYTEYGPEKLNHLVDFPIYDLDITNYLHENHVSKYTKYNLFAINNHDSMNSNGINFGHYYSYCKNSIDNKWYNFDDDDVSEIHENKLVTNKAYMLFYEAIN